MATHGKKAPKKTVRTPKGSPNSAIQGKFLGDFSGVGCSHDRVNRCPRASVRGYFWSAPAGLMGRTEYGTVFAPRCTKEQCRTDKSFHTGSMTLPYP